MKVAAQSAPGSATVVVILVTTILGLCALNTLQNRIFMRELVYKQQLFEQRFWATDALLKYGIAWCKKNRHLLTSQQQLLFNHWPEGQQKYSGICVITPDTKGVKVSASLYEGTAQLACAISCRLEGGKQGDEQQEWVVHAWKIEH